MIQKSSSMELKQWLNLGLSRFQIQHHISDKGKEEIPTIRKKHRIFSMSSWQRWRQKTKGSHEAYRIDEPIEHTLLNIPSANLKARKSLELVMKKQNRVAKLPNSGRDLKPQITNYTSTTVSIANAPPRSFVVETLTLIFHGSKCSLGCSPSSFGPQFLMIWDVILVCQTWGYCSL